MDCRVCNSSDYDARNGLRLRGISVIAETAVSLILIGRLGATRWQFRADNARSYGVDPHHILALRLGMSTAWMTVPDKFLEAWFQGSDQLRSRAAQLGSRCKTSWTWILHSGWSATLTIPDYGRVAGYPLAIGEHQHA